VNIGQKLLITLALGLHLINQAIPNISEVGPEKAEAVLLIFILRKRFCDAARRKIRQAR
jgi:hypothetical protein